MKIQILSDSHNDLSRFKPNENADLIIHAGDFNNTAYSSMAPIEDFVNLCNSYNKECAFVLGNHDYYGQLFNDNDIIQDCLDNNYNLIDKNKPFEYKSKLFIGGLFGTDFKYPGDLYSDIELNKSLAKNNINDFRCISYNYSKNIIPEDYIKLFNEYLTYIDKYRYKENVVLVSHFPLTTLLSEDKYKNSILNPYFLSDVDLTGFKTVISGHTHTTKVVTLNDYTTVYTNAIGNINKKTGYIECPEFDTDFLIEID